MKIKIFTTGGSIDKYYSTRESDFIVGEPQIQAILRDGNVTVDYEVDSIFKKDSLEISDRDRQQILEAVRSDPHRHIIITHGTDTMVDTANLLKEIPGKVIVLTGSMQPSEFKHSDAAFNIGGAVAAVQALDPGVYILMNGRIFEPGRAKKNLALERFEES